MEKFPRHDYTSLFALTRRLYSLSVDIFFFNFYPQSQIAMTRTGKSVIVIYKTKFTYFSDFSSISEKLSPFRSGKYLLNLRSSKKKRPTFLRDIKIFHLIALFSQWRSITNDVDEKVSPILSYQSLLPTPDELENLLHENDQADVH